MNWATYRKGNGATILAGYAHGPRRAVLARVVLPTQSVERGMTAPRPEVTPTVRNERRHT